MDLKFRYRIDANGYYVPQYQGIGDKWFDFTVGQTTGELQKIAVNLSVSTGYSGRNVWHYISEDEDVEEMPVFFTSEVKVAAYLGAAKVFFGERVKDFNLDNIEKETQQ